jgi:NAD-dependent SIR2 family protein deacetylase
MVTVKRHGKIHLYQGFCLKCFCTVEYTENDIMHDDVDYVICPDCGEKITRSIRIG